MRMVWLAITIEQLNALYRKLTHFPRTLKSATRPAAPHSCCALDIKVKVPFDLLFFISATRHNLLGADIDFASVTLIRRRRSASKGAF